MANCCWQLLDVCVCSQLTLSLIRFVLFLAIKNELFCYFTSTANDLSHWKLIVFTFVIFPTLENITRKKRCQQKWKWNNKGVWENDWCALKTCKTKSNTRKVAKRDRDREKNNRKRKQTTQWFKKITEFDSILCKMWIQVENESEQNSEMNGRST